MAQVNVVHMGDTSDSDYVPRARLDKAIDLAEWRAEGERRFGLDPMKWAFVCPACGHVQTVEDYRKAGAPEKAVAFSCVGRWLDTKREAFGGEGPGPCNYAGGGLFAINPVVVESEAEPGFPRSVFAFANVC